MDNINNINNIKNSSYKKGIGTICWWIVIDVSLKFLFLTAIISFSGQSLSIFLFDSSVRNSGAIKFHQNQLRWWSMSNQKFLSKYNQTVAFPANENIKKSQYILSVTAISP